LFTTERDVQLTIGKKSARIVKGRASFESMPSSSHDRAKKNIIEPSAYYLKALGITTDDGQVRSDQRDKWKQINKFVEVVAWLIENSSLKEKTNLRIVDLGSGKGYLTFALYNHLQKPDRKGGRNTQVDGYAVAGARAPAHSLRVTGVERRPDLVSICSDVALASGFDGLNFVIGTIADFDPGDVDILIALHACDTATDDAIYKGITSNASIIVAAPCCHHEVTKQMKPPGLLKGILKHPVMLERTAETITDGIRSMLLEAHGYKTKMFEFVATEHTPKNNLLVATRIRQHPRTDSANDKMSEIAVIKAEFGIEHQRLVDLLAAN
jgi:hypothetical protein